MDKDEHERLIRAYYAPLLAEHAMTPQVVGWLYDELQSVRFAVLLNDMANIAERDAGFYRFNPLHHRFVGDLDQFFGPDAHFVADIEHPARIAVPAFKDNGDVDIERIRIFWGSGMPWQTTWLTDVHMDLGNPR